MLIKLKIRYEVSLHTLQRKICVESIHCKIPTKDINFRSKNEM